jgi:Mrp family chromosome partitioning ATPase/capsular polysaccharide biosynthesis protein
MSGPATLADYLTVLQRRKWIIFAVAAISAVVAYKVAKEQAPSYRADATVLVNRSSGVVSGVTSQDPATYDAPRFLATLSSIARAPELATRVVAAAGLPGVTPDGFLGSSSVAPDKVADLLKLSVSSANANEVVPLVNAYAREFTRYKTELDTERIDAGLRVLRARAKRLREQGVSEVSGAYDSILQSEGQLEAARQLVANGTSVLEPAEGAAQISGHPRRSLIIGALLGVVMGFGLALLIEALDRRVRTGEEIGAALGLGLLGRLARPPRRLRRHKQLVMLAEPTSARAEAFRKVRTSVELANREPGARVIMFTSAEQREGKSTTAANVAIAFARAGRRVALVDLDVRLPSLHSFFGLKGNHGITDVVLGHENVLDAIEQIALPAAHLPAARTSNGRPSVSSNSTNGRSDVHGVLHVLPCGTIPPADAEFLESDRVTAVLEELGEAFDIVIVDSPPLLAVGGAMSLSTKVDAIVLVTRLGIRRPILQELGRQLQNCPAASLGYVVTDVPLSEGYGSGYGYGSYSYDLEPKSTRGRQPV